MNARLVIACALGFAAGAVAFPLSLVVTHGASASHPTSKTRGTGATHPHRRGAVREAPLSFRLIGGRLAALSPLVHLVDDGCKSFSVSTNPGPVALDDPRYQPCTPTTATFLIQWQVHPTAAQDYAAKGMLVTLGVQQPTISLQDAAPLIMSAIENAR